MFYTGIDHHKRYAVACTLDAPGRQLSERRIDHIAAAGFVTLQSISSR